MKFNERNTTPDAERSDFSPSGFPAVAIICALTAILSGCTLSKPPVHSQIVTDALPLGTTIPPHWSSVTGANDVVNDWLKSFNDPRLNAVVSETINNNLDLRQAAAQVEVARQSVVVVASQLLPRIGINLGMSTIKDDGHDKWGHGNLEYAGISWEPDIWGRLRAQTDVAQASYQATALDYAFARQSLAAPPRPAQGRPESIQ